VESLSASGTTVRLQVRTAPNRQDDVARELRRRVKIQFDQQQISLSSVQRVELVRSGTDFPAGNEANSDTEGRPSQSTILKGG
jgi:replicative superfamily II helicase